MRKRATIKRGDNGGTVDKKEDNDEGNNEEEITVYMQGRTEHSGEVEELFTQQFTHRENLDCCAMSLLGTWLKEKDPSRGIDNNVDNKIDLKTLLIEKKLLEQQTVKNYYCSNRKRVYEEQESSKKEAARAHQRLIQSVSQQFLRKFRTNLESDGKKFGEKDDYEMV